MQEMMLKEVIFSVSLNLDDMYEMEAFCYFIAVQASTLDELRCRIRTAVQSHF